MVLAPSIGTSARLRGERLVDVNTTEPSRDEAWALYCGWTQSDSLRKHALGVESAMRAYAGEYGED